MFWLWRGFTLCKAPYINSKQNLLLDGQCVTTPDSPDQGVPCAIPFKFDNKLRDGCITDKDPDGKYWCSTKVNENFEHIAGAQNWGFCEDSCPKSTAK